MMPVGSDVGRIVRIDGRRSAPWDEVQEEDIVATVEEQTLQALAAQVQQLSKAVARQEQIIVQQHEELGEMRARMTSVGLADVAHRNPPATQLTQGTRRRRTATTRRRLLAGAGATAAAATVALMAGEQHAAHAASATDGQPLVVGQDNATSSTTSLTASSGSTPAMLFQVDASNSGNTSGVTAISGIANQPGTGQSSDVGVFGYSAEGTAVYGSGFSGIGVRGSSFGSQGVYGSSNDDAGVMGVSAMWVDLYAFGSGRIAQKAQGSPGAPTDTSTPYVKGEMIRDSLGELWICVASGQPGTWAKVAHLSPGETAGGAITYLSKPVRLLDTRNIGDALNNGNSNGAPLAYNGNNPSYTLQIAGVSYNTVSVPSGAVGAIGNVTVVATAAGGGYVALVPSSAGFSGTSNVNYAASQIIGNFFSVGLGSGALDIYIGGYPTQVIIDLFAVVS